MARRRLLALAIAAASLVAGAGLGAHVARSRGPASPGPRPEIDEAAAGRARDALRGAQGALEEGRYADALAGAEWFLRAHPEGWKAPEAARIRAAALVALGRAEEVGELPAPGPPAAAGPWLALGRAVGDGGTASFDQLAREHGEGTPKAFRVALVERAVVAFGDEIPPEVGLVWSRLLREDERHEEQLACYDRILASHPDHPIAERVRYGRARLLGQLDRKEDAERATLDFLARHPGSEWSRPARLYLGELRVGRGDQAGAAEQFSALVEGDGSRDDIWASAWVSLAWTYARRDRPAEAAEILARELDRPGTSRGDEALWTLARFRRRSGDEAGADRAIERLLAEHPGSEFAARARREGGRER